MHALPGSAGFSAVPSGPTSRPWPRDCPRRRALVILARVNTPTDLSAIAYLSSAVRPFSDDALDALLVDARAFNNSVRVTGVLLHHDRSFFQYLEGPADGVAQVYERVKASQRHRGLIQLLSGPVGQRHFRSWHMGFADAPGSALQSLAQAEWLDTRPALEQRATDGPLPPGLRLLTKFWQTWTKGPG